MNLWNINIFSNLKSFVFYISKNVLPGLPYLYTRPGTRVLYYD